MVDALREAQRVLTPSGVLIDVRPVTAPIVVEVVIRNLAVWAKTVDSYSAPEDVTARQRMWRRRMRQYSTLYRANGLSFETSLPFNFEVYCDTAAELRVYAGERKLRGAEIPYQELEERRREVCAVGQTARLRCRRT